MKDDQKTVSKKNGQLIKRNTAWLIRCDEIKAETGHKFTEHVEAPLTYKNLLEFDERRKKILPAGYGTILSPREIKILELRLQENKTLEETADAFRAHTCSFLVHRGRVHQIQMSALRKIAAGIEKMMPGQFKIEIRQHGRREPA